MESGEHILELEEYSTTPNKSLYRGKSMFKILLIIKINNKTLSIRCPART